MIEVKIPLKKFAEINGKGSSKGQTIICEATHKTGILDHFDVLGICRTKEGKDITTAHQAYIVLNVNDENELIEVVKKYKPTDLWL
jgi:hypothetical protein